MFHEFSLTYAMLTRWAQLTGRYHGYSVSTSTYFWLELTKPFQVIQTILKKLYFIVKATKPKNKVLFILLTTIKDGLCRYNSWLITNNDHKDSQKNILFNQSLHL